MSFFQVKNLTAAYGNHTVLQNVCFEAERGCMLGLLGANGSGKSTLLKAICGILPHGGDCWLDGMAFNGLNPRQLARLCGYIPQRSGIGIDISVRDVVLMGFNPQLGLLEHPDAEMRRAADCALARAGLEGMGDANYLQLSEGQKQLCILARTLVARTRLMLLDEPESALDFRHRHRVLEILRDWLRQEQGCAIIALHDPGLALNFCDRLLILSEGGVQGVLRPATDALEAMELQLEGIYGKISLHSVPDRDGGRRIVMLKERE